MGNTLQGKKKPVLDNTKYNYYCEIQKNQEASQSFPYEKRSCTFGQEYIYFQIPIKKLEAIGRDLVLSFYDQTIWHNDIDGLGPPNCRINSDTANLNIFEIEPTLVTVNKIQAQEYRVGTNRGGTFIFRIPRDSSLKYYTVVYIRHF